MQNSEEIKCEECNKKLMNLKGLSQHVKFHDIKIKDYYDKYLKCEKEGECPSCNISTTFRNITDGYNKFCSYGCSNNDKIVNKRRGQTHKQTLEKYPEIITKRVRKRAITFNENPELEIQRINNISITKRNKYENMQNILSSIPYFLYIIKHYTKPIIKIGRSENPNKRLKEINRDFGECYIVNILESTYNKIVELENHLQDYFKEHCKVQPSGRGRTEWFDDCISKEVKIMIKESTF